MPQSTQLAPQVSVVIPARNEAASIGAVIRGVYAQLPDVEVIVIDDASTDDTADVAEAAGAHVVRRPYNIGNGAGVKTGVRLARGEFVAVIDADGQHDPADLPRLLSHMDHYDMVIGERDRAGQASLARWLGNSVLNRLGSYVVGMEMRDLTSGLRMMRRSIILDMVDLLPNQFSWPTTSALAFAKAGYHVRFEPIKAQQRTAGRSAQKVIRNFFRFLMIIFKIVSLFAPLRVYTPVAIGMLLLGVASVLLSYFVGIDARRLRIPGSAVALFVGAIVVQMFGFLAEQIALLWFQRRPRE